MGRIGYFSIVFRELGGMLVMISPLTAVPLVVAVLFGEWNLLIPMALVPFLLFLLGSLFSRLHEKQKEVRLSAAFCSVALVWMIFALVSTIPFILALHISFTDALFETMAGWTGTGFTLMQPLGQVPETLIFWRVFMQWIGGIGVIALSLALASRSAFTQSSATSIDSRNERILTGVITAGKDIWAVYFFLTIIGIGLILVTGVSVYDAVLLCLTTISTGGFSPAGGDITAFHRPALQYVLIPIMIIGSTPFTLYYLSYRKRKISILGDEQVRLLFLFLAVGTLIVVSDLFLTGKYAFTEAASQGLFMTSAVISTTGLQNGNPHLYPSMTVVFLTMLMFIGGASGSTAGGIKLSRVALAYRGLVWWFKRIFVRTKVLVVFKYEGKTIPDSIAEAEISKNMLIIILAFLSVFIATMIILQFHILSFQVSDLAFDIVSALSCCGVTTGYVSPGMPLISKWVFIFIMWIGRLEVIPVLVLFIGLIRGPD